ncbi:N-acetylmuramoyl-L-alanine amidase [Chryseobacterium potabilaquae]|uniref:N-acetylmuramoyl-L-alanine amidase n=1 Tax=Chryseobacterium potabilaquae TaxID=2675057 RepID=A0A6N4X703_9FLAO|nr:N-acetylmuramoyl-L-alanine amidase [Chryseobacterium potabilaquae]CAA7196755.1 N-acetylmuramoyl-L-alanine amidase LytC [Chryseobacterium potabilaquae]
MIFISAGHHNNDPGAVANGYIERDLTKDVRNIIIQNLDVKNVIQDKDFETNAQYQRRIKPGSGSVVFDIHFNSGNPTVGGTECYVNQKDFADKNSLSYKMADEICKLTSKILGIRNRGVKPDSLSQHSKIGILNLGSGISVLWEICFISSVLDMQSYLQKKNELLKEIVNILRKYDAQK